MSKSQRGNTRAAKLTNAQVMEVRQRYAEGETQGALCRAFGMSVVQIGRIVRGESRRNLPVVKGEHEMELEARASAERMAAMHGLSLPPTAEPPSLADKLMAEAQAVRDRGRGAERALEELAQPAEGTSGGADK